MPIRKTLKDRIKNRMIVKPEFIDDLTTFILEDHNDTAINIPGFSRPSSLGWECSREGYYMATGDIVSNNDGFSDYVKGLFNIGNIHHAAWPVIMREADINAIDGMRLFHYGYGVTGTPDIFIINKAGDESFLIEIKTIDPGYFDAAKDKPYILPQKKHKFQWAAYDLLARRGVFSGYNIPGVTLGKHLRLKRYMKYQKALTLYKGKGFILYINKNNGERIWVAQNKTAAIELLKPIRPILKRVAIGIKNDKVPKRHHLCSRRKNTDMYKVCPYAELCYSKAGKIPVDYNAKINELYEAIKNDPKFSEAC